MRRILFAIFVALFAMVQSAVAADAITSLKVTTKINGSAAEVQELPPMGFPGVEIDVTSLIMQKIEVGVSGNVEEMALHAAVYKDSPKADSWDEIPMSNMGNGTWVLDMGEGIEIVEEGMEGETRTFEFYVAAKDGSGSDIFFNNGGQNYKIKFTVGVDWTVKYYGNFTASIGMTFNETDRSYSYSAHGIREQYYGEQPGEVGYFNITDFSTRFIYNKEAGVTITGVNLLYNVHQEGTEGAWKSIAATLDKSEDIYKDKEQVWEHRLFYSANNLNLDVIKAIANPSTQTKYEIDLAIEVVPSTGNPKVLTSSDMNLHFTLNDKAMGVDEVQDSESADQAPWYTVDGVELTEKPTAPGIYIHGGKKVVVK